VAQQEAEIMEKKKQSEILLRAQFAEAMKAHEQVRNFIYLFDCVCLLLLVLVL
jgi:hypothetical protein